MRVAELIEMLQDMDENAEVRLAIQPRWPFEHEIANVVEVSSCHSDEVIVYIAEGTQLGYLPGAAKEVWG